MGENSFSNVYLTIIWNKAKLQHKQFVVYALNVNVCYAINSDL